MTKSKLVIYGSIVSTFFFFISVGIQSKTSHSNNVQDISSLSKDIDNVINSNQILLSQLRSELKLLKTQASEHSKTLDNLHQQSLNGNDGDLINSSQDETQLAQDVLGELPNEAELKQTELDQAKQVTSTLDNEMSNEPFDELWAPEMQATITATLQNTNFQGSDLLTVNCQSSLCRIDIEHENMNAEVEFLHNFVPTAGYTDTQTFFSRTVESDGRSVMTYYISRDGYAMPLLEEV